MNIRREQTDAAPHECTECKEPAYIGFTGPARCTNWKCSRFDQKIWEEHVMSLPDPGDPEQDFDDEPTEPRGIAAWHPDLTLKLQGQQPVDIDTEIAKARHDMANAKTGWAVVDASWRVRKLLETKLLVEAKRARFRKSIDTVSVPCYNVGNDD